MLNYSKLTNEKLPNNVNCFLKREVMLKRSVPRRIQARNHTIKLLLAPVITEAMKEIYKQPWCSVLHNKTQRAQFLYENLSSFEYFLEIDFSKYDAHQSQSLLYIEYLFLKRVLGTEFADSWWLLTSCRNDGKAQSLSEFVYSVLATRMSGEHTTTGGNTLINKVLQEFIFDLL